MSCVLTALCLGLNVLTALCPYGQNSFKVRGLCHIRGAVSFRGRFILHRLYDTAMDIANSGKERLGLSGGINEVSATHFKPSLRSAP